MKQGFTILASALILTLTSNSMALPNGFVYLEQVEPSIIQDMKYFSSDNFIGRPIKGYAANKCILTIEAAQQLKKIQQELRAQSLGLKVFDCYRPQTAVDDFISWSQDANDQKMKKSFFPNINKADFFTLGYVAAKSTHTRGSTVDLSIVQLKPNQPPVEMEMGTHFDFMDPASHPFASSVSKQAQDNRLLLRNIMQQAGFEPYEKEWWHFTLQKEAFPDTYFNFPVR